MFGQTGLVQPGHNGASSDFDPIAPWPLPAKVECAFYHDTDLPGGERIVGYWDIRGGFDQYIGHYPIKGKTVLDVGTASGFLAFEAERAGAVVTAADGRDAGNFRMLPFRHSTYHEDRATWLREFDDYLVKLKNSFWYAWHRLNSKVEVVYAPIDLFPLWGRRFDVVIAGAIVEHLSDPVTAIGNMAALAREALILAFTPVEDTGEQIMRTATGWDEPPSCYTWWSLSRGLYERLFMNLGFSVEFKTATAELRVNGRMVKYQRPTIIARRL